MPEPEWKPSDGNLCSGRPAMASPLTFVRPSRSGGPAHQVRVDADTLCPIGCTCRAGRNGLVCWASLEVATGDDLKGVALARWQQAQGVTQLTEAARLVGAVMRRAQKARRELALRDGVGSDPDVRWLLTAAGADALARATAEAWVFGAGPSVAEACGLIRGTAA
jgi:hypothetical protein